MQKFDILKLVLFWYFSVPAKSCIAVLPEVFKKGWARKSESGALDTVFKYTQCTVNLR